MKSITVCCILIAGLCLCACLPVSAAGDGTVDLSTFMITLDPPASTAGSGAAIASVNDNYPISVEQAKNNIRVFTGDLDMDPVLSSTGTMPVGNYYRFTGNDSYSYYLVNQNSGLVEFALMAENMPSTGTFSLSRDEAYAKGTDFARAHFENFDAKTWKIVTEQQLNISWYRMNGTEEEYLTVPTYLFALRGEQDHVLTPDTMTVLVSAVDGKVLLYGGIDRLLLVDLKPTVTMSGAVQEAEKHFGGKVTQSRASLSVVTRTMNVQSLAWMVTLHGTEYDYEYEQTFAIDAVTGDYLTGQLWPDYYSYFLYYGY
ncbi:MAG: hypothetical protein LUQ31_09215 [Methanoregula sp.]|nr:hypothetical protein [Methanoregula sp.]